MARLCRNKKKKKKHFLFQNSALKMFICLSLYANVRGLFHFIEILMKAVQTFLNDKHLLYSYLTSY